MKSRSFSTLCLWTILALTTILFRAEGAVWLAAIAAMLTQYQLYKMLSLIGHRPLTFTGMGVGLFISLSPMLENTPLLSGMSILAPAIVLFSVVALLRRPRGNLVSALGSTFLGLLLGPCTLVYVGMMIYHFGPEREGLAMGMWLVMATKFTDMGALLTGIAIGRHKLAPTLSPKKTWEGAVGGVVLCVASSAVFAHFCAGFLPSGFTPVVAALIALPVAVAAIFADLLESAFKRESGVKDSGNVLPGIGGVFDLTDSFMLSAPLAYYATALILG